MAGFDIQTSAPGKILLLGGYAVVERPNIGYAITVNSRVHVRVRYLENRQVKVSAPQFGVSGSGSIDPKTGNLDFALPKEMTVLKDAVEIPIKYLIGIGADIPGFHLEAYNDSGFASDRSSTTKSGLGSSAGVTVAGIAAALAVSKHGSEAAMVDKDLVHKLAQLSHGIATGRIGSGYDIAAATYGSLIYTRYSPSLIKGLPKDYTNDDIIKVARAKWDYTVESFGFPEKFGIVFANFVNESTSTAAFVTKVNEFKAKDSDGFKDLMLKLNGADSEALESLKRLKVSFDENELGRFKDAFETGRHLTKELGMLAGVEIESDGCSSLINKSMENGAFVAKLPGSGGKDSLVALTIKQSDRQRLVNYLTSVDGLKLIDLSADNVGVRVDSNVS
jgi:phosphomevalonate kinase